ncbi:glycosyl hydrolase [Chitinophaga sancti]|uniref:glycosyl hydrolase n=1 Tax=Chitinophaga sancti TaxID=1004 RepID=UPI002A75EF27|nr:glycosyl hydrolase [Chitinophaga sancti]WPQ61373.1 glycosyl hydrolase [Chitinophaga sancti]
MHPRIYRLATIGLLLCGLKATAQHPDFKGTYPVWPSVQKETKPWTRWWWMGSAVDSAGLTNALRTYNQVGFGGVEIAPIYGAKGFESKYVDFLSPQWIHLLKIATKQATRLHMGVDLTTGTGWPFGGPQIDLAHAAAKMEVRVLSTVPEKIDTGIGILQALVAYKGVTPVPIIDKVQDGHLHWEHPAGNLTVYALYSSHTKQKVKRAAPGGEGYTLDHLSGEAVQLYLHRFDSAFQQEIPDIRAFYNDSYEVYGADWTPSFLPEFKRRRGYDLTRFIREFTDNRISDTIARVKSDYRETMAELLLDNFTKPWTQWAHDYHRITKNQAHGSPGNLIDLYATVDIPECETFGSTYFPIPGLRRDSADIRNVSPDPIMMQFATSAGHIAGHPLISSETFTWLTEHFKTSLSQCKPEVEQSFLAGVNHVFYHGTTYSPKEVPFPGWLFYASVNFVPANSWWSHLPGLNEYITRVQSVLQAGRPDNDLLVYWPVYDIWNDADGMEMPLSVHHIDKWLYPTDFYKQVMNLHGRGYTLDFVSDSWIAKTKGYKALIIPKAHLMPLTTLQKIIALAQNGTPVIFQALPEDVPGMNELDTRRKEFQLLLKSLAGRKNIIITPDVEGALHTIGIRREALTDAGLKFIRRNDGEDTYYYIVNHTANKIEQFIPVNRRVSRVFMLDPLRGDTGLAQIENTDSTTHVKVQLASGESIILKAEGKSSMVNYLPWKYLENAGKPLVLQGPWQLEFKDGGPFIPAAVKLDSLVDWTTLPDTAVTSFSGKGVYTTSFQLPAKNSREYLLQLDKVHESAHIWINGQDAGIMWSIPFTLRIGKYLRAGKNDIRIEVANLMANHIRYMDRHHIPWRQYHEINFVNINYKDFDASNWGIQPSGLEGKVTITPYN